MTAKVLKFVRPVNGVLIEQRVDNGFLNGTSMSGSHRKQISDWLTTEPTWNLLVALSGRLGIHIKEGWNRNSSASKVAAVFPHLLIVRRGSPLNGGGTWIHPKLAVHLAQWCSPDFALLVSDWVEEWLTTGKNPIHPDFDQQFIDWQERYDIRMYLKDFLRPELMTAVVEWALNHKVNPRSLCAKVHDVMNERIQGAKSRQIRLMGGLPLGVLIRDYFGASPLVGYSAINQLAKNAIQDRGLHPIDAVHEACDHYLGKAYVPKVARLLENVHVQGRRLGDARKRQKASVYQQLPLWDSEQAM